ncbi:hypothetical protein [Bacteriophage sp.]|nr:hypothetical protein [Bacteriophage sp.]
MPIYRYKCSVCGIGREIVKKIADIDRTENCLRCSTAMNRQICAPAVRGDYAGYECPVTGKWIEGRRAHEENLKRQGCRVLEPGETAQAAAFRKAQDEAFDKSVDATVDEFIETLPTAKKEQLANEVSSGLDVSVQRL